NERSLDRKRSLQVGLTRAGPSTICLRPFARLFHHFLEHGVLPMRALARSWSTPTRLTAIFCAVALGGWLSFAQEAAPRRLLVADVKVSGNRRVPTQTITAQLKTKPGVEYNPEAIQEDVRALLATRQFGNVQARYVNRPDGKVDIFFVILDYPNVIEDLVFEGAH